VTQARPDIDTDGFPLFPPLPGGLEVPITARSLPRLVASLNTGVLTAEIEEVAGMVVFVDRQPVDGMALRGGRRVTGADALDEIADVPVESLSYRELPRELAAVLGSYFLPTEVSEVPAARVLPEAFLLSLARPDGRGCVLVRAGGETGLVFLAAGQVVLALRAGAGDMGGLETISELLADPEARLWARLGPLPEDFPHPGEVAPSPAGGQAPVSAPAVPAPQPTLQPAPQPVPAVQPPPPSPAPAEPAWTPAAVSPVTSEPVDRVLERVLERVRQRLGRHSAAVEEVFRNAPQTADGLRSAAESVRGLHIRLVSPATLEGIADDAIAILHGRSV
jgi:hypothetical protein